MALIVEQENGKTKSLSARFVNKEQIRPLSSDLAWKILQVLSDGENYPKEIARKLKVHEQKVYYHIRNLEKAGIIKVLREERRVGALTKFYSLKDYAFAFTLKPLEESTKLFSMKREYRSFLEPFVLDGKFNSLIVIGSHEPHGPAMEIAHDGISATNLALFLGTFLNYFPSNSIKFDTELKIEDLKKNLILIGGPGVNSITTKINAKLPIQFKKLKHEGNYYTGLYSKVSGKTYSGESYGIIVKTKNPFDKSKSILVIAGKRFAGTKGCVLAFSQKFDEICSRNSYNKNFEARVVNALDLNGDGEVDFVEFIE